MSRTIVSIISVLVFVSVLMGSNLQAEEKCTKASLEGRYGYLQDAFYDDLFGLRPSAIVGSLSFDGKGDFSGAHIVSNNGQIMRETFTGTYTVNPDCTGSYEADTTLGIVHSNFVIVGEGDELLVIRTDTGQVLTFIFRKQ